MARHAQAQQKILQGSIDAVKARYKNSPAKLAPELSKLYEKHGVKPIDGANLVGMVAQVFVGAGVYSAIRRGIGAGGRFFWIRNLAQPNAILAVVTAILSAAASVLGPHLPHQSRAALTPTSCCLYIVSCLAAGLRRGALLGRIDSRERPTGLVIAPRSGCMTVDRGYLTETPSPVVE